MPDNVPLGERNAVTIREDAKGRILLTGLHQVNINSVDDLLSALNFGSLIRQTDATAINAQSSRSHAIFSLNLIQRKNRGQPTSAQEKRFSVPIEALTTAENWVTIDSKLHFVDLAGSERLKNTGASGERAKEGISINGGLASLGKVISQLSSRQAGSHVSYRDSKLTRLLQDSLGGNAITYMIACVTPAEFHLSETLNTVQYAQRARAIQSKPEIQQVANESDKQAAIDRLRAEVSFLRDQIRSSERGERRNHAPLDRVDRQNEREVELQNHLLDVQENYSALSQRHAKLISEITKARDNQSVETPTLTNVIGDSAVERLKRSNSFAEAVEQVVLEYEKTIQSLETSLSNTRSSLATTESSLMERETKCAYVETMNQQLQTRLQKLIDRESSTEHYLHDLEAKLDGRTSGEERNLAIMTELRKEIARVRENEASCEDYISTLEERLAESDQDLELMQREIGRLEHVVERQRSLGKLDNLLQELDHIHSNGVVHGDAHLTNGLFKDVSGRAREGSVSRSILDEAIETAIPESDDEFGTNPPIMSPEYTARRQPNGIQDEESSIGPHEPPAPGRKRTRTADYPVASPAQSRFVPDKLESVSQELFDLRVEHESTVNEYDLLSAKYEQALRALATLQEAADDSRRSSEEPDIASSASIPTTSFLGDARVNELKDGDHLSSSRSLLSELSSAGVSPSLGEDFSGPRPRIEHSDPDDVARVMHKEGILAKEMESLKKLHLEKEESINVLTIKYDQLQEQHMETLDIVEELKAEVKKAKMLQAPASPTTPVVRRKTSQNVMAIDRAHRSLASLGNIAAENFEDQPDTMQNFELNLNTAMHELHQRSERVQVLEAELAGVRREMETKMTIISGLTRERSSLKGSSPMDISVVSSMRDQLLESENQIRMMHEGHAAREKDLQDEIHSLQDTLMSRTRNGQSSMPGVFPETPAAEVSESKQLGDGTIESRGSQDHKVAELQGELSNWEDKHRTALQSMKNSEEKLLRTIAELEASLARVEATRHEKASEMEIQADSMSMAAAEFEKEKSKHVETVYIMQNEIDQHKSTISTYAEKIRDLEQAHATALEEIEEGSRFRSATQNHIQQDSNQIAMLERQVLEQQSAVEFHKYGLKSLHESHARELEGVRAQAEAGSDGKVAELSASHEELMTALTANHEQKVSDLKSKLDQLDLLKTDLAKKNAELEETAKQLKSETETYNAQLSTATMGLEEATTKLVSAESAKATAAAEMAKLQATIDELTMINKTTLAELEALSEKEQRAKRLVDELEKQIASTYDETQATSSRLSVMQSTRDQELSKARVSISKAQEELEAYRNRLEQIEVSNITRGFYLDSTILTHMQGRGPTSPTPDVQHHYDPSGLRKSSSVISLPSPPPAIPLPPLPTVVSNPASTSPPGSRHASNELASAQMAEDQEARIRTIEKHLFAEKQLTATLEEALVDLESQGNKVKTDMESWKKKAWALEDELGTLKKERNSSRYSVQAVEEERNKRWEAERARAGLEERMLQLSRKKKKNGFNCF